uniref:AGAP006357 n=1 Tax=Anopheles coluzzii TaxID=1518534 RepID=A0A0D3QDX3_ANOCL|nr:AGAP006357 [Anopheles coluzzii]
MDESGSKGGGDKETDEKSPPKKAKTVHHPQPSTSSSSSSSLSGRTASSSNMASTSSACGCGATATASKSASASAPEDRQSESNANDPPPAPRNRRPASAAPAAAAANVRSRTPSRDRNAAERNASSSSDEDAAVDDAYFHHLEQSVRRLVHRNVRNLGSLRSRQRNDGDEGGDGAANADDNEAGSGSDGGDHREQIRIRNQLADNIAELLAPGFLPNELEYETPSEVDSAEADLYDDEDNNWPAGGLQRRRRLFGMEEVNHLSSDSSRSSLSSASTASSSTDGSESYIQSSESDFVSIQEPSDQCDENVHNLECLQTSSVKCKWNIVREISQRQHGIAFHRPPATVGRYNPIQFQTRAYGSVHLVQRLGLLHKLAHHTGCVNSLNFHPSGKLLASGSDDLRINLWHWESKKLLKSIRSGHKNNVFQTKFMTCDGYGSEIEIISTGRDGHVRHTTVKSCGQAVTKVIFRSQHPIHKVAIPARNDLTFLMAGEDEKVRLCDMRQAKMQTVVDVGLRLYSIATHPYDTEFCVSGSGSAVRVYDLRRAQKPLRMLFVGEQGEGLRSYSSITCAVYNHDGTEILASYSDDDIYLFKLAEAEAEMVIPTERFRGHCNVQTIKGVSFFGPRSEFVVSGSDCGYVYIWEKSSRRIVNWLRSNPGEVVNCLEPHPAFPILATSGVDNDIKVWVPKGLRDEQTAPVFEWNDLKRYVRRNVHSRTQHRNDFSIRSASNLSRIFPAFAYGPRASLFDTLDDDDEPVRPRLDCNPS